MTQPSNYEVLSPGEACPGRDYSYMRGASNQCSTLKLKLDLAKILSLGWHTTIKDNSAPTLVYRY
jgi:hypothetical protein